MVLYSNNSISFKISNSEKFIFRFKYFARKFAK